MPDDDDAEEPWLLPLIQRDLTRGWITMVPKDAPHPAASPMFTVPKSNGSRRLVVDDSSKDGKGNMRGPNGLCSTALLPFPDTVTIPTVAAWLAAAPARLPGQKLFLMAFDISTAFRRLPLSALARGSAGVSWAGVPYRVTTCSMGSRWSSSAMNAVVHAVATSLVAPDGRGRVLSYCDDCLAYFAGTYAQAMSFRGDIISRFCALGLPMAEQKCPLPCLGLEWIGLTISTRSPIPTIRFSPKVAAETASSLAAVSVRAAVRATDLRTCLGRIGWLACIAPPVRLWVRRLYQALAASARGARYSAAAESAARRLHRLFVERSWRVDDIGRRRRPDPHPRFAVICDASGSHGGALVADVAVSRRAVLHTGQTGLGLPIEAVQIAYPSRVPASTRSELITALAVLQHISGRAAGHAVSLWSDNMSVVAAARGRASARSAHADDLGEALALCLMDHRIFLSALHVPGVNNGAADSLSRTAPGPATQALPRSARWSADLAHVWARFAPLPRHGRLDGIIAYPSWRVLRANTAWFSDQAAVLDRA